MAEVDPWALNALVCIEELPAQLVGSEKRLSLGMRWSTCGCLRAAGISVAAMNAPLSMRPRTTSEAGTRTFARLSGVRIGAGATSIRCSCSCPADWVALRALTYSPPTKRIAARGWDRAPWESHGLPRWPSATAPIAQGGYSQQRRGAAAARLGRHPHPSAASPAEAAALCRRQVWRPVPAVQAAS